MYVILWEAATGTAAAYRPVAASPQKQDGEPTTVTLYPYNKADVAGRWPTRKTGLRWDVAGRAYEGQARELDANLARRNAGEVVRLGGRSTPRRCPLHGKRSGDK